jgi:hypothetical protein
MIARKRLSVTDRWTDRWSDVTKLVVAFHNSSNAPKFMKIDLLNNGACICNLVVGHESRLLLLTCIVWLEILTVKATCGVYLIFD